MWDPTYGPHPVVNGEELVQSRIDFYCKKVQDLEFRKTPIGNIAKQYKDPASKDFKEEWEVSRDAIIVMAAELGPENIRKKELNKFKTIVVRDTALLLPRRQLGTSWRSLIKYVQLRRP